MQSEPTTQADIHKQIQEILTLTRQVRNQRNDAVLHGKLDPVIHALEESLETADESKLYRILADALDLLENNGASIEVV